MRLHPPRQTPSRREFLASTAGALALMASANMGRARALLADRPEGSLTGLTLQQASDLLRRKEVSAVELTQACLARIEKYQGMLNAFITVTADKALTQARAMDTELQSGK